VQQPEHGEFQYSGSVAPHASPRGACLPIVCIRAMRRDDIYIRYIISMYRIDTCG